jgi:hypothetical protein
LTPPDPQLKGRLVPRWYPGGFSSLAPIKWKNRFQDVPFKWVNLRRYATVDPELLERLERLEMALVEEKKARANVVGRCALTPPDPYIFVAERRLVPRWFQPLHVSRENRFQNVCLSNSTCAATAWRSGWQR